MKKYILIALFMPLVLLAQKAKNSKADAHFDGYNYDKAISAYESMDEMDVEHQRKLAISYLNRNRFIEAEYAYKRFINKPEATIDDYFNYALLLKMNNNTGQVAAWMRKIQEESPDDLRAKDFFENEKQMASWQRKNPDYSVVNLDFNSEDCDFGAVFYKDQVVFTSTRKGSRPFVFREYTWNKKPFLSLFTADLDRQKQFSNIQFWNKEQNKKWHEGPVSFSNNYTFAAFTRNNYSDNIADNTIRLEVFFTRLENGKWTQPEPFYLNNPAYSVGHPALSADGKTMFFVSDMPGGFGGSDIYFVQRTDNGVWGEPVNAGITINTEGNEEFPFYESKNALLFFSSNGRSGLGGLDIFVSPKYSCCFKFDKAENLGAPINSRFDDFAFVIDPALRQGFFSSNQPLGMGDDDIYSFTYKGEFKKFKQEEIPAILAKKDKELDYRLKILNRDSRKPIEKASVSFGKKKVETDSLGEVKNIVKASLLLTVDAIGYKQERKIIVLDSFEETLVKDTVYLTVASNERIVLNNIYYDFDKSDILPESAEELDKLVRFMKDNPTAVIELSSHTDSRGSDAYNIRLSDSRAKSAVAYIISKGINPEKITAKGYGETRLRNDCKNGVRCSEEEHRENRRTEIFISGYGDAQHIKQTKGKY